MVLRRVKKHKFHHTEKISFLDFGFMQFINGILIMKIDIDQIMAAG